MDSDALAVGPIDELLTMNMEGRQIGVTQDFRGGKFSALFNMGVCKITPNSKEYSRLLRLAENKSAVVYETAMCEQGWLNTVYRGQWKDIGFKNNANMAALTNTKVSAVSREDLRVVHFTTPKPWECVNQTGAERYCKLWHTTLTNGLTGINTPAIK
jgi:lipopolysaccharide biosynthesis glycosyltransferase